MNFLGLDPGPKQSAITLYRKEGINQLFESHIFPNEELKRFLDRFDEKTLLTIEMIASYGMPVGREVFETCVWIGRFIESWGAKYKLAYRGEIKMHFCHSMKAKDSNIRQALIDRFGEPGTKPKPGLLYRTAKDMWSSTAIAVYAFDKEGK